MECVGLDATLKRDCQRWTAYDFILSGIRQAVGAIYSKCKLCYVTVRWSVRCEQRNSKNWVFIHVHPNFIHGRSWCIPHSECLDLGHSTHAKHWRPILTCFGRLWCRFCHEAESANFFVAGSAQSCADVLQFSHAFGGLNLGVWKLRFCLGAILAWRWWTWSLLT